MPTKKVNIKWRKLDKYNSLIGSLGYHSSHIKKAWIRNKSRKKYGEQQALWIRAYYGTYIVELIDVRYFPFDWKIDRDKSMQFETYQEALKYAKELR